jgi:hypothetical protein
VKGAAAKAGGVLGCGGVRQAIQEVSVPGPEAQDSSRYLLGEGGICCVELTFVWHSIGLWLWFVCIL